MLPVSHYENDDEDYLYYFKSGSPLVAGLCNSESTSWFYVCVFVRIYTHTHTSTLTCAKNRNNTDNTPIFSSRSCYYQPGNGLTRFQSLKVEDGGKGHTSE